MVDVHRERARHDSTDLKILRSNRCAGLRSLTLDRLSTISPYPLAVRSILCLSPRWLPHTN